MVAAGDRLAIDFGTFNTVAMLQRGDDPPRPLLIDGSPLLPSAVFVEPSGEIVSGRDALHSARLHPERFEPNPKRRMSDGMVLLGDREIDVLALVASVVQRVATEAERVAGRLPAHVVATHPEAWGTGRCRRLGAAVRMAGLPTPRLVSEPVAAAAYFLEQRGPGPGGRAAVGRCAVIYDFGAGTFDASVVRRDGERALTVLAGEGLPDVGGLDLDAALVEHLGKLIAGRDPSAWKRLSRPATALDRRARWQLWEDVRLAKEALSRRGQTLVHLPVIDDSVPLTREELEVLIRPILARTVAVTRSAVRGAGVRPDQLAGVFLVGGSSRIPLVATLLHRAFGVAPTVLEQPELVVAEGALRVLDVEEIHTPAGLSIAVPVAGPGGVDPTAGGVDPPAGGVDPPAGWRERARPHLTDPLAVAAAVVLGGLAGVAAAGVTTSTGTQFGLGLAVALVVYVVRVAAGLLLDEPGG